jgi:hypothetical protein
MNSLVRIGGRAGLPARALKCNIMKNTVMLTLAVSSMLLAGCCTTPHATQWEYKVVEKYLSPNELQKQIDAQLPDGWEFVTVSTAPEGNSPPCGFIVFRKPKQ